MLGLLYLYRFRFQKDGSDTEEQQKDAAMVPMSLVYLFVSLVTLMARFPNMSLLCHKGHTSSVTMFARCFARSLWTATPTAVCQGATDVFFARGPKTNWHRWVTGIALQMAVGLVGTGKQINHITSEKDFQLL